MAGLGDSLRAQCERGWDMLREAMERFPEEGFRSGDIDYLIPARQAMHLLATAEFYTGERGEDLKWGERFEGHFDSLPPEELPDRETLLACWEEIGARVRAWFDRASDENLLGPNEGFHSFAGATRLERMVYTLRHHQQHLGEMNAELRRRGLARADWR